MRMTFIDFISPPTKNKAWLPNFEDQDSQSFPPFTPLEKAAKYLIETVPKKLGTDRIIKEKLIFFDQSNKGLNKQLFKPKFLG
jgi:hypothetical protein